MRPERELRPRFAAGNCDQGLPPKIVVEICRLKCGQDLPPELRSRFAARLAAGICRWKWPPKTEMRKRHHQWQDIITGKGKGYDASGSEEPYVDLSQHKLCFSLTWNKVLRNGGEAVLVQSWALSNSRKGRVKGISNFDENGKSEKARA